MNSNQTRSEAIWPADRIAQLAELVAKGLTYGQIGIRMGITRNQAIGKATRLGLARGADFAPSARQAGQAKAAEYRRPSTMLARLDALDVFPGFGCCVYPMGNPGAPHFHFCGTNVADPLKPYCDDHERRCWQEAAPTQPAPERRRA